MVSRPGPDLLQKMTKQSVKEPPKFIMGTHTKMQVPKVAPMLRDGSDSHDRELQLEDYGDESSQSDQQNYEVIIDDQMLD